ncbi:hypothetical protein Ddye_028557 [Dipteronia dyeriana]|uniref:Uncharacterized protein n=1 Tax=Dipteronia dyeriana TaxID=168575 RepID=A0AAD9WKT3_9ROSI|nr:hypothetical protein Ddye_028557 [Dipteronia dyeriana]
MSIALILDLGKIDSKVCFGKVLDLSHGRMLVWRKCFKKLRWVGSFTIFKRNKSLARRINFLVQYRSPPVKEYIQSTALDNCLVPTTTVEQYVDLQIDQQMIDQWIREGYSHLHIGAVRIILTLDGRKGLPVTAKIALLNTIYKQYEHTVIGTCLSTLHIPKQLPRDNLKEVMSLEWITNYEKVFQNTTPVIASDTKVQNKALNSIDQKIDRVTHHVSQHEHHLQSLDVVLRDIFSNLQSRIAKLDANLHRYINHGYFGLEFDRKEREIRQLREQLEQVNRDHLDTTPSSYMPKPYPYTQSLIFPTQSLPYSPSARPPNTSQYFKSTRELFQKYPPLSSSTKPSSSSSSSSSSSHQRKPAKKPTTTQKKKKLIPDQYKLVLYTSLQTSSSSESETESLSNESSQSSWNSDTATSSH